MSEVSNTNIINSTLRHHNNQVLWMVQLHPQHFGLLQSDTSLSDFIPPPCIPRHLHTKRKPLSHIFLSHFNTPTLQLHISSHLQLIIFCSWYMYAWVPMALADPTYHNWQPLRARELAQADFRLPVEWWWRKSKPKRPIFLWSLFFETYLSSHVKKKGQVKLIVGS